MTDRFNPPRTPSGGARSGDAGGASGTRPSEPSEVLDEIVVTDDLDLLLAALPPRFRLALQPYGAEDLLEIVMDLGRLPEARYVDRAFELGETLVTEEDLAYVIGRIGTFGDDNRAGIGRTLHRISALRNRRGQVVGLTCRVGRAVRGTVALIRDVVEQGRSILILGRPGVGKTTLLREAARVLADDLGKRVVVVDTSNEIAGDGDVPHPGIGRARRMQVARPAAQHQVMIEAVENHMPEVIVIDEIGTELEAQAARTIAERGVQLVGTAHGRTLDNLLVNPTLADLVGGVGTVTLGDEEARRRGTQKTVLERKAPPTFDVLVEQESWRRVILHHDVGAAVDEILRGHPPTAEERERDEEGHVTSQLVVVEPIESPAWGGAQGFGFERGFDREAGFRDTTFRDGRFAPFERDETPSFSRGQRADPVSRDGRWPDHTMTFDQWPAEVEEELTGTDSTALVPATIAAAHPLPVAVARQRRPMRLYPYGVSRDRLEQSARQLRLPVEISHDQRQADAVITVKSFYRRQPEPLRPVDKPVIVLRSNTVDQMAEALANMFAVSPQGRPRREVREVREQDALLEAEDAINHVLTRGGGQVELAPQSGPVRRMQHRLAERYNLISRSRGKEPNRRVRIFSR
jgi:stage III sporulation protein SpoIIIAA